MIKASNIQMVKFEYRTCGAKRPTLVGAKRTGWDVLLSVRFESESE